jgi:hypothetical protein
MHVYTVRLCLGIDTRALPLPLWFEIIEEDVSIILGPSPSPEPEGCPSNEMNYVVRINSMKNQDSRSIVLDGNAI